jgi:hypothetical protein
MWRLRRTGGGADFRKVRFPGNPMSDEFESMVETDIGGSTQIK